jgi:protein-S-isoprenylcysteine O-methyltransferase Ste14
MRATDWEFKNRALLFGLVFGVGFTLYAIDPQNATAAVSNWAAGVLGRDPDTLARLLFAFAACLLAAAATIRTWASACLQAQVVYAADVKTEALVADGPYRYMRNPLYFANILLSLGLGAMMSRIGFLAAAVAMTVFCYRLIFREEADMGATQGGSYASYQRAVPRLLPAARPRIPSAGSHAKWAEGFKAEFWCWGFASSVAAFAVTLNPPAFFAIMGISLAVFWFSTSFLLRRR